MLWPDLRYEAEVATPFPGQSPDRTPVEVAPDLDRLKFFQQLCKLRAENEVLRRGRFRFLSVDNEPELVAFERFSDDHRNSCLAFFNVGSEPVELPIHLIGAHQQSVLASGLADGELKCTGFVILMN